MLWQILTKIGFTEKGAKLYLAMLELGSQPVSIIAKKAGLNRTTTYLIINELKEKGLISEVTKQKILYYSANSPNFLVQYLESQKNELSQQQSFIKDNLSLFQSLISSNSIKPNVQFFEGLEGIKNIYLETLKCKGKLLSFWGIEVIPEELKEFIFNVYIPKRVKSKISINVIARKDQKSLEVGALDTEHLRETRFYNEDLPMQIEINIYNSCVALIAYGNSNYAGVIIENDKTAEALKTIHTLVWNYCRSD